MDNIQKTLLRGNALGEIIESLVRGIIEEAGLEEGQDDSLPQLHTALGLLLRTGTDEDDLSSAEVKKRFSEVLSELEVETRESVEKTSQDYLDDATATAEELQKTYKEIISRLREAHATDMSNAKELVSEAERAIPVELVEVVQRIHAIHEHLFQSMKSNVERTIAFLLKEYRSDLEHCFLDSCVSEVTAKKMVELYPLD